VPICAILFDPTTLASFQVRAIASLLAPSIVISKPFAGKRLSNDSRLWIGSFS
jgi:hypothetical protein